MREKGEGKQYEKKNLPGSWVSGAKTVPKDIRMIEVPDNPTWASLFLKDDVLDAEGVLLPEEEAFRKGDTAFVNAFQYCGVN